MLCREASPVVRRRERPTVRRRLTVGPADDAYEREADAIAAEVLANLTRPPATMAGATAIQRRPADGPVSAAGGEVPATTASRIRPSGDRFDGVTRQRMETAFGADFSDVRVHTSATIDTAAVGLQADAFTLGRDVYVRRELYRPGTPAGDELLAHELTHTLQQGGSRIRRSTAADVSVRTGMPANRVSRKKQLLYLDFVKMKRYDPKYGKAIKDAIGMDVGDDDNGGGMFGHWWTEVGKRDPDSGAFTHEKSYGWWPKRAVDNLGQVFGGIGGRLNKGKAQDPHAGETGEAGLTEFHPAMNLDLAAEDYDTIKARVTQDIDTFATGYNGPWQWKLGWGQNCHTFQQAMKTKCKMHYQKAKGWLEDPSIKQAKAQQAADAKASLALVGNKKWFTYTQATMGTVTRDGDDGPALALDDSREFAPTGKTGKFGDFYVQECVTRTGAEGWVPEVDLRAYSNM